MIVLAQSDMSEHETAADASANASSEQRGSLDITSNIYIKTKCIKYRLIIKPIT